MTFILFPLFVHFESLDGFVEVVLVVRQDVALFGLVLSLFESPAFRFLFLQILHYLQKLIILFLKFCLVFGFFRACLHDELHL